MEAVAGTADHPDPLVTMLDQVLCEQLRGLRGCAEHDVDVQLSDAAVERDDRDPCVLEPPHTRSRTISGRADDRAVDSKRRDGAEEVHLSLRAFIGVAEHDRQALLVRDILDLVDDLREEWVRQIGDEDCDYSQAASAQSAGQPVRDVAELFDRAFDATRACRARQPLTN